MSETIHILLSLGCLLLLVRGMMHLLGKIHAPSVAGELLLGILIGPTVLGAFAPGASEWLFPMQGNAGVVFQGLSQIAVVLLLFVAGLETNLGAIRSYGKAVLSASAGSMAIPFLMGFLLVSVCPALFHLPVDIQPNMQSHHFWLFSCFIGVALAISALPVIIRILMDLGLYQSRVGVITVASASLIDVVGWVAFALVLNGLNPAAANPWAAWMPMVLLGVLAVVTVILIRQRKDRPVAGVQVAEAKAASWFDALPVCIGVCLLVAGVAEVFKLHATLGAFLTGALLSNFSFISHKVREQATVFVTAVLSPLFFISIGAQVNFATNLDLPLIALLIGVAVLSKVCGTFIGGRLGGVSVRETLVLGFALSARGAMEIILSKQALEAGLIQPSLFVALVVMALFTSLMSGSVIKCLVASRKDVGASLRDVAQEKALAG